MKRHKHLFSDLWESYPTFITNNTIQNNLSFAQHLSDIMVVGSYYHYVISLADYSLHHVSETVKSIHGLEYIPTKLNEIIGLIHPDDLKFVLEAEETTILKMKEIGFEHALNLKTSYCFRMKTANNGYQLFHHQAVHLANDEEGKLSTALNIHTNISHITQENSKIVLINGIKGRNEYIQVDLSEKKTKIDFPKLSKREMDILPLLANGLSSYQIADQLFISTQTVQVHRKNILHKTKSPNTSALIKKCIESGLL